MIDGTLKRRVNAYVGWVIDAGGGTTLSPKQVEKVDALFEDNERLRREADVLRAEVARLRVSAPQWAH